MGPGRATPAGQAGLLPGLLLLLALLLGSAACQSAQPPPVPPPYLQIPPPGSLSPGHSLRCDARGESTDGEHCFPPLRRCIEARFNGTDIECDMYSAQYRTVDGYAYLDDEMPHLKVSSGLLLPVGPADCWNVVPGNYRRCAVCRFQALGNGFCRAAAQPVPGCQRLAHPHINEDCAVCEPGYCLDSNHKCLPVEAQPAGDLCGDRCFGQALRPDGFDCAAWPMATMAPSDDEPAGRPEHRHLLRCSAPGVCFQCHDTCDECAGPGPKDCTACPAGHFLLAHGAKDFPQARVHVGTCIRGHNAQGDPAAPAGCPATTVNTGQDVCVACRQDCLTCDPANPGHCLSCMRGFFAWPDGTCSATCPEGMVKDSLAGRCVHCTVDHCTRCVTDNPGVCIACHADRPILFHNQCVDSCPPGYRRSGTACLPCKANCLECDGGPDSCSTCRSGFFLRNDTCHSECGCTHFWDEDTPGAEPGCRICSAACHTCAIRATNCVTCLPGMMLVLPRHAHEDHQCAATCPAGWYKSGSLCKPCTDPKCVGCYGGGNTCHTCAHAHAAFERRECFNPCPEGYYKYDKACLKCGGGCGTCYNGLGIGCITCRVDPNTRIPLVKRMQPGTFDHTLNAQCVSFTTIQAGWGLYFQDQKNHYTVPCPENCAACFVDHPHDPELRTLQCTECASGFVLADDRQTCVRPDAEDSSA